MNYHKTRPFLSKWPQGYKYLEIIYRQMNRRSLFLQTLREYEELIANEELMHCGILDVRNKMVYHYSDYTWKYQTLDSFMTESKFGHTNPQLYYEKHDLSESKQLKALMRAYKLRLTQNVKPYCLFFNNCQIFVHQVVYNRKVPGQVVKMIQVACYDLVSHVIPEFFNHVLGKRSEPDDQISSQSLALRVPRNDAQNVHCTSGQPMDHHGSTRLMEGSEPEAESYKSRFCSRLDAVLERNQSEETRNHETAAEEKVPVGSTLDK